MHLVAGILLQAFLGACMQAFLFFEVQNLGVIQAQHAIN